MAEGAVAAALLGLGLLVSPPLSARPQHQFQPYLRIQGENAGCGTTALAMVLNWWREDPEHWSREGIDAAVRRNAQGTLPTTLSAYARSQGFHAVAANRWGRAALDGWLGMGWPVLLAIENGAPREGRLHYVVVLPNAKAGPRRYWVADPWTGTLGFRDSADLLGRWRDVHWGGLPTGVSEVAVLVLPASHSAYPRRELGWPDGEDFGPLYPFAQWAMDQASRWWPEP